jgi:hypothetical protein
VGVARRLDQGLWINEAGLAHELPPLTVPRLSHDLR